MANILVIDDDDMILKTCRAALQKAGHTVVTAKDGHGALDVVQREVFDLVITDANMPGGISGFNLVSTLRKVDRLKDIPMMFLTGRRDRADVVRAVESGVDDYMVKPIDQDLFLAKVEALLQAKRGVHSFGLTPAKADGEWMLKFAVTGVSEQGLMIVSPLALPVNKKIVIASDIFDDLGFASPQLRVASCKAVDATEQSFTIMANFIGLTEGEHKLIRRWVMDNQPGKAKKSS